MSSGYCCFQAGFAGGPAGGFDVGGLLNNPAMMNMVGE